MLGRMTDQGVCLADLQDDDLCAYSLEHSDGVHAMLRRWHRAHAMGMSRGSGTAAADDAAAADATYLDSIDWVANSDCLCCNGGHVRRAGMLFGRWLQQLQEVEGVREWIPHAQAVLKRVTGEGLDPNWPSLRSTETIRGILYYSNPATERPVTYDVAFGTLFKGWASYDEGRLHFPENGVFPNNLGSVYFDKQLMADAMACFFQTRGLQLPFVQGLEANIASVRQMTAQWTHYDEDLATVRAIINHGGEHVFAVRNLYSLALPLSLDEHVRASAAGAAYAAKAARDFAAKQGATAQLDPLKSIVANDSGGKSSASRRVHVCYISGDILTGHAVAQSVRRVIAYHSASVDVTVFGRSKDAAEAAGKDRKKVGLYRGSFIDASQLNDVECAQSLNSRGCMIVMDLNAQTGRESMGCLSLRPAAVQIHYLGFPASTGAQYIDFIIGDAVVSPPEMQHGYAEKLLVMPFTFQVTSHADEHPHPWGGSRDEVYDSDDMRLHRAAAGMPVDGSLMCNFNQVFKLDPQMFDLWLNITASAPGSSLVMLRYPPEAERFLRATMRSKGLRAHQLRLLSKADLRDHFKRETFCDLFLDNREYNAGTTCTDSLWAGVPLLTLPREKHAGRHSASMLSALGGAAAASVARSMDDYRDMAVKLLNRPHALQRMQASLRENWSTSPLFDVGRWVVDVEVGGGFVASGV